MPAFLRSVCLRTTLLAHKRRFGILWDARSSGRGAVTYEEYAPCAALSLAVAAALMSR